MTLLLLVVNIKTGHVEQKQKNLNDPEITRERFVLPNNFFNDFKTVTKELSVLDLGDSIITLINHTKHFN